MWVWNGYPYFLVYLEHLFISPGLLSLYHGSSSQALSEESELLFLSTSSRYFSLFPEGIRFEFCFRIIEYCFNSLVSAFSTFPRRALTLITWTTGHLLTCLFSLSLNHRYMCTVADGPVVTSFVSIMTPYVENRLYSAVFGRYRHLTVYLVPPFGLREAPDCFERTTSCVHSPGVIFSLVYSLTTIVSIGIIFVILQWM